MDELFRTKRIVTLDDWKEVRMSQNEYNLSERLGGHGLLHTPEGVRDIYNSECEQRLNVENSVHHKLHLYGFKDIQTPTFEFFDIFNKERGTIASNEMYKFFDKEGNTLVLRPDITPSIARCAAKYYKEEELPVRLCYVGNTYINNSRYQGKLKETTQIGAELMNDDSSDADAEMIAMTIECLLTAGLTEFQLEIGHADFVNGILEEAAFDEEEAMELKILMESKNLFGVEELVSKKSIDEKLKEIIIKLPELFGDSANLSYAREHVTNQRSLAALERLEKLSDILSLYGLDKYITFDLGMLSKYNYYTGIIFRAFTYGTGEVIVTGGRYDQLVGQFGKSSPAIGFAIVLDQLMLALSRQKVEIPVKKNNTLLVYEASERKTAIELGNHFRKGNMRVELVRKSSKRSISEYVEYGKRNKNGGILYIAEEGHIQVINILSGEKTEVSMSDLLNN